MNKNESLSIPDLRGDGISRRTINKTLAWSVPIVAAAVTIPAAAASVATNFTTTLTTLQAAPGAVLTGTGNQGEQALLNPDQLFNTFGQVLNNGPAVASGLRAQVTFDQDAIMNQFAVNSPWEISSITENPDLGRWLVNLTYTADVPVGGVTDTFIVEARTRLAPAFPAGQSGAYSVLGRAYNSDATIATETYDYFYVSR